RRALGSVLPDGECARPGVPGGTHGRWARDRRHAAAGPRRRADALLSNVRTVCSVKRTTTHRALQAGVRVIQASLKRRAWRLATLRRSSEAGHGHASSDAAPPLYNLADVVVGARGAC